MTETPEAFAYRCLPLNIANAHGWEVLSPCTFDARWWGGTATDQVEIKLMSDSDPRIAPVSLFGQGILTFHIAGLFRTPPGWNLWVGGSPNRPKENIYPLTGVVETDWAPYTFTMNWRFTRRYRWVRFEAREPICFSFRCSAAISRRLHRALCRWKPTRSCLSSSKPGASRAISFTRTNTARSSTGRYGEVAEELLSRRRCDGSARCDRP